MSKSKPETIVNLKINWVFSDYDENETITVKQDRFKNENKSLLKYSIKKNKYIFLVDDAIIEFSIGRTSITSFIEWLNFELVYYKIELPRKLIKFELISDNTFRIYLESK